MANTGAQPQSLEAAGAFASTMEAIIWFGGAFAGVAAILAVISFVIKHLDFENKNALKGSWYGYGYFLSEDGDRFYREKIEIGSYLFTPFSLKMRAEPCSIGSTRAYKGYIKKKGDYIYTWTSEPHQSDTCFELAWIKMRDAADVPDLVIGIHVGGSYINHINEATAFIWTRQLLDSQAVLHSLNATDLERQKFEAIVRRYFHKSEKTFQLLFGYGINGRVEADTPQQLSEAL